MLNLDNINELNHYKKYWYTLNLGIFNKEYYVMDINESQANVMLDAKLKQQVYYNPRFTMTFLNFDKLGKPLETIAYSTKNSNIYYVELDQVDAVIIGKLIKEILEIDSTISIYNKLQRDLMPKLQMSSISQNRQILNNDAYYDDCLNAADIFREYNTDCINSGVYKITTIRSNGGSFINGIEEFDVDAIDDISYASSNFIDVVLTKKNEVNGSFKLYSDLSNKGNSYFIQLDEACANRIIKSINENQENLRRTLGGTLTNQMSSTIGLYEIQKITIEYDCENYFAQLEKPSQPEQSEDTSTQIVYCKPCVQKKS